MSTQTNSGAKPALSVGEAETIPQLIAAAAAQFGDKLFLEEKDTQLSFADFSREVTRVAAALISRDIQPGDRIAVWAPNISEWVVAALGAQCAGAVLVTLNTRYKANEACNILRQSRARMVFSMGTFLDVDYPAMLDQASLPSLEEIVVFRDEHSPHTHWQNFLASGDSLPAEAVPARLAQINGESLADILFTSGTTGKPKGVMAAHRQNIQTFTRFSDILGLTETDRYLVMNPFFHSYGYKAGILVCLLKGVTLLPHAIFDSEQILKRIATEKITVLPGAPTLFQSLLAYPKLSSFDISSLRCATTGAASIPVELIHQMKQTLGFERVITAYGLTESCGLVTMCRPSDSAETIAETSGRAIPDIELRCVDSNNQPVASGENGEIVFRGFNVMKGYFEDPAATAEAIDENGWLHTGDIGNIDQQGNLRITDRMKDMFIAGGFNCYPAEIENILASHPAIAMNAVIGAPDKRMGEVALAFVVLKPEKNLDQAQLIDWCREQMANYKVPRQVRFIDSLPLNASGKVVKSELRELL